MKLGEHGENSAVSMLEEKGYQIIARNYRTRHGEIDIIAADASFLVFVEVKERKNSYFAAAREFVDKQKRHRVVLAAQEWLSEHPTPLQPRFDVVEVYTEGKEDEIIHLENAFDAEGDSQ